VQTSRDRLRRVESVTDASLAHLELPDLLDELLDRVREVLEVDTAAVLLLDPGADHVVATAAKGIEEEVTQGVRIPVGGGFAGRIAAEKQPVILDRVDHTNVLNPILQDRGIHSMLGVPLLSEGEVIGVLHVGTLTPRRFTSDDADLLQLVADRVALATQAGLSKAERRAARMLQSSLLPGRLPRVAGMEFAARYVPGEMGGVGGDWYDVFELPSGPVFLVIGDVAGKGLRAAVVMGRMRGAVRSYALTEKDPAEIVALVDRHVLHFETGEMATMLLASFDPSNDQVTISSAGHPPPVLAVPGSPSSFVALSSDPPLGAVGGAQRHATTIELAPGAVLCMYTDGLVERRADPIDERLDVLRNAVLADAPESVCMAVMRRLVGAHPPSDDIAMLVARYNPGTAGGQR
jgi:hypothetical protein